MEKRRFMLVIAHIEYAWLKLNRHPPIKPHVLLFCGRHVGTATPGAFATEAFEPEKYRLMQIRDV